MLKLGNIIISLITLGAIASIITTIWVFNAINSPGPLQEDKLVYIASGSSIKSISKKLTTEGIIESALPFMLNARILNRGTSLKAGEYNFPAHISINDAVDLLQSGKTYHHQITIPEGLMAIEIVETLKNNEVLDGEIENTPKEGSLLPETYSFSRGDTRQEIIKRMQDAMQQTIDELWETRAKDLPIKTKEEAITFASIIEKETGIAEERARVAGVFINRLNGKIPLQTDPTVIYSITEGKEKFSRKLYYKDLKNPSPYNTYLVQGLPPGPIANPGRESIKAALNPEENKYIYFVADGTGGHVFSKTLKEHNNNVRKWRKIKNGEK